MPHAEVSESVHHRVWITSNATVTHQVTAQFYILLGLVAFGLFVADHIIVRHMDKHLREADVPNTVTYESRAPIGYELPRWLKALMVVGPFLGAGYLFVSIGGQPTLSIVSGPTFQLIDLGPGGSAFLSAVAGI